MINENLFLEAAEYEGYTWEFANRKIEAYLDTRCDSASIESFVIWLREKWQEELQIRASKLNNGESQ